MSQGYAIELYFDPALENQVLKAWNILARRQISTHLIEIEARPHITLFASPTIEISKLQNAIKNFALKQEPLALIFSSVGSLCTDENVLFLAPTPTHSLLTFHNQLLDLLKREGLEVSDGYQPDKWIPYCSVAENVPRNGLAEAFSLVRDFKMPISGYGLDIGVVEFSPVREHFTFALGGSIDS